MEILKLKPDDVVDFETLIGIFWEVFEMSGPIPGPLPLSMMLAYPLLFRAKAMVKH